MITISYTELIEYIYDKFVSGEAHKKGHLINDDYSERQVNLRRHYVTSGRLFVFAWGHRKPLIYKINIVQANNEIWCVSNYFLNWEQIGGCNKHA